MERQEKGTLPKDRDEKTAPVRSRRRRIALRYPARPGRRRKGKKTGDGLRFPGRLYLSIALGLVLLAIAFPVSAHEMAGGVDHPNGIDDLWPIHATLMTGGISTMLVAMGIVQFGKKRTTWWYRVHPVVGITGAALSIGALAVAISMVSNSGQPHLQYIHGWLGGLTIAIIIATPIIMIFRRPLAKKLGHPPTLYHRLAGFTAIGLMAANILLGLSMMHVI